MEETNNNVQVENVQRTNIPAILSLIFGIIGIIMQFVFFFTILFAFKFYYPVVIQLVVFGTVVIAAISALVFGVIGIKTSKKTKFKSMAIISLILCGIVIGFWFCYFFIMLSLGLF